MMRNANRDLLRLSLTAIAFAGLLLLGDFEASRAVALRGDAMARTDSIRYGGTNVQEQMEKGPDFVAPRQAEPVGAPPADSSAAPSARRRSLLALLL